MSKPDIQTRTEPAHALVDAWADGYLHGWRDRVRHCGHPPTFRPFLDAAPTLAELYADDPDWQEGRGLLPEGCRPAGPKEGGAS